jgi:hypothetical protein
VNIKKMATTVAFAALGMMVWVTFKVYFIHDPDNFFEVDARPYLVAWMMDNCKAQQCAKTGDGTPVKSAYEFDEGWLYVLQTTREPGEIYLLVPREDPSLKHLVSVEEQADGDVRIVDTGPRADERRGDSSGRKISLRKQFKYALGALAAVIFGIFWIRRRMNGDKRPLDAMLKGEPEAPRPAVVIGSRVAPQPEPDPLAKTASQYQALMGAPDKAPAVALAPAYIGLLLKAGKASDAVGVFEACIALDAGFRLAQAEDVLPVAKAALAAGRVQSAVAAVRGFDKKYPGHALVPDVYVFSARLMAEKLGNAEMARKLLQHVAERYPGHHLAQEARRTLQAMA